MKIQDIGFLPAFIFFIWVNYDVYKMYRKFGTVNYLNPKVPIEMKYCLVDIFFKVEIVAIIFGGIIWALTA